MPGPLSSTLRLTLLPATVTAIRTVPPGPAYRQALSTRTAVRRSIHSGGALIHGGLWSSSATNSASPLRWATAEKRFAHAAAIAATSTGSSPGGGGAGEDRARQWRVFT